VSAAFLYFSCRSKEGSLLLKHSLLVICLIATASTSGYSQDASKDHQPALIPQKSGTTQLLIAVSPVNSQIVWAAGAGGTYVVTTDGGSTWKSGVVPGAEALQFRDVHGVSERVAYLMSIGNDTGDFRIYKTEDAGAHWSIQFKNKTVNAFYDCFAFWTSERGITHSDSVNGVFPDIRTTDGQIWHSIARDMPHALSGEASFSSSGTCITTEGWQNAWIATGGSSIARILSTRDGGDTWNAYDTPLRSNANAGGFSVAFRDPWHGIVAGGDLTSNSDAQAATSDNGGQTWTLTTKPPIPGAIFGLAYVRGHEQNDHGSHQDQFGHEYARALVVTAETQPNFTLGEAAWTPDEGQTWFKLPKVSGYWAVAFANPKAGWFVGNNGKILKISW
jgi:photosystem II stability/assembly factor-like uncharacterized protein